jgi:hypothetical protein
VKTEAEASEKQENDDDEKKETHVVCSWEQSRLSLPKDLTATPPRMFPLTKL